MDTNIVNFKMNSFREDLNSRLENGDIGIAARLEREIREKYKNFDYLSILPSFFTNSKKSKIKDDFFYYLDNFYSILTKVIHIYNDGVEEDCSIKKEDIILSIMIGNIFSLHELSRRFFPSVDKFRECYRNSLMLSKNEIVKFEELDLHYCLLTQTYDLYIKYELVRSGKCMSLDIEKDGYPSTSRGALCYLFTPVNNLSCNWSGKKKFYRKGKEIVLNIIESKNKGYVTIHKAKTVNGDIIYLIDRVFVEGAYSNLYDINKEIYAGWWNRTLSH